jgi:hypothetical protein
MSTDTDVVKVSVASLAPDQEGHNLKLTTNEGVEINFNLDDMAVALLSMTAGFVIRDLKDRKDAGEKPFIHTPAPKENPSE